MPPRFGLRPVNAALVAVIVFVIAGMTAAQRALSTADQVHARGDAEETAARIEGFLMVHATALHALDGFAATAPGQVDTRRFTEVVAAVGEHAPSFRRIWLADTLGRVVRAATLDPDSTRASVAAGTTDGTGAADVIAVLTDQARRTGRLHLSAPLTLPSGEPGFIMVEPIYADSRLAGFAGGSVPSRALRELIALQSERDGVHTALLAGPDTLAVEGAIPPGTSDIATADVRLPGDGTWMVAVQHTSAAVGMRAPLWIGGVGMLAILTVGLMYERREARRIVERSGELERLSDELLRANRAKSEFLANISHELRTPLNAIVGFADLLRDGVYGELSSRQAGPVQRIEASAGHLRHLVDQVLDLAKMAAGRLEVHREPVALRPFVLDVAAEVEPLIAEKGLSMSLAVGATLPRVRTDPTHLRQILINLLGNAVRYTEAGGVAVRARLVGPPGRIPPAIRPTLDGAPGLGRSPNADRIWIALQVVDSGIGIVPENRERIFDEFEQVNAGPRGDSMNRGTGLGLPISRRLARLLGGELTVESEPGKGSSFTVWLPIDEAEMRAAGSRRGTPPVVGATS